VVKKSTIIFGLSALFLLVFGVLYVIWPLAPYHEDIIGMSSTELVSTSPDIAYLLLTGVDVTGLTFIGLGILMISMGFLAWQSRIAWYSILLVIVFFALPLSYIVAETGGPYLMIIILILIQVVGLIVAFFERKENIFASVK